MTKVEMTRETLIRIAGYSSLKARQLAGRHILKKNLKIDDQRLAYLADRFTKILNSAGVSRWVMASTLRADGYKVSDCITLMMKKGFDIDAKPDTVAELIVEGKKEL